MQGFWQGRSVLVTGAGGFLGGWLVSALLDRGADVVAILRDGSPQSMLVRDGLIDRISTVRGDIQDFALLRRAMSEYDVQTVFHLAAQAIVGVAKVDPIDTLEINVRGSWNVLEAARLCKIKQIVVASSDKAYGSSANLPYREDDPLRGSYPYDVSKSCTDLISAMYATTYGLPVAIARCANLFGGGDLNFSRTIPGAILATMNAQPLVIRSDGKFVRDLLYVKDAAAAYLLLAEQLSQKPSLAGEAFNFSMEVRHTVLELLDMVLALMDRKDLRPIIQNAASSEIREQYLSTDKAARILGWKPEYNMTEALQETINWYRLYYSKEPEKQAAGTAA